MAMSTDQARVIDPILSEHARGYSNAAFIGGVLFPTVDMPTRAAKRIEFGRESFKRYRTIRAPGARLGEVSFGYEGKTVSLTQHALSAKTPVEHQEEASEVPGIDVLRENLDVVLAVIALEKEIAQATLARTASLYAPTNKVALVGDDRWTDPDSDPLAVVSDYKEVVRKRTGRRPNTMALAATAASALKKHPKLLEHYKHTTSSSITVEMMKSYFELTDIVVGDAIYDDDAGNSVDVWGNDAILAFVPPAGQRNMRLPGYGYTYQLRGHPMVEQAYYDKSVRSWRNDVFDEYSPELVGADAAVLIQNAG